MPRYYCDYCDTYLTHDSPSVRKQHNSGYKHKANVRTYYQQFEEQQTQSLIDQRIKEHLGQTAAYQQVGAAYNQHLVSFPQRPRLPVLPMQGPGMMPLNSPVFGIRPPVLPRPITTAPGYASGPMMPPMVAPPLPMQFNGVNPPPTMPGGTAISASNGAPAMTTQAVYQGNPTAMVGGVLNDSTDSKDGFPITNSQASEPNR